MERQQSTGEMMDMVKRREDRQSRMPEVVILCISIIIVAAIGGSAYLSANSIERASAEQKIAQSVVDADRELLSELKDAETGQRGYLVTGRDEFLELYNQALAVIPGLLARLKSLTQSAPAEREPLRVIEPLVKAKLAELKETIGLRRANRIAETLAIVNAGSGKRFMDELRLQCAAEDRLEQQGLEQAVTNSNLSSSRLRIVGTAGAGLLFCFLIVSAATIFRGLNRRDELFRECYESERRLAVTLASIADGVICTDAAANVTFLNSVAGQLTGWPQGEGAGRHISEIFRIVDESTRQATPNPLERAIAEGRAVGLANHTKLIARDDTECFIDDSAAPIRSERGEIVGAVLVFRDISEQRRAERELAESALALQRSNEELQQFAFTASHDLQSPLRSVKMMAELLARQFGDRLGNEGSEMVRYITAGADRMTRLVDDLLSLAKATNVDGEPVGASSVQAAFDTACSSLSAEIKAAGATITSSPLPIVAAREIHVVLVLQNILGNGLKYRGAESPVIRVSAERGASEWVIGIRDNGIGIDPQYADKIFQPFKRLHGPEYEGTGLGLWTCKRIVSGYGGNIWLESEKGRGSTFFFSLPATVETDDADNTNDAEAGSLAPT